MTGYPETLKPEKGQLPIVPKMEDLPKFTPRLRSGIKPQESKPLSIYL
jgi:hypothetical protein